MLNVGRNKKTGRFESIKRVTRHELLMALVVFAIGFLTAYSASAAQTPPSAADWEAWGKLKPVKKFDYEKVYDDIDGDLAQITAREDQFAQDLPIQLSGPMHAINKKEYRGRNARLK